jgi:hypothetical protein
LGGEERSRWLSLVTTWESILKGHCLKERSSPGVARFLTREYVVGDFKDHVVETELYEDVYGDARRPYWLSEMQMYTWWQTGE